MFLSTFEMRKAAFMDFSDSGKRANVLRVLGDGSPKFARLD